MRVRTLMGSEPVKSVSADGTYFVYNCGGSSYKTSTNSSSTALTSSSNKSSTGLLQISTQLLLL
tara:strand:- start:402 stop:593 length:192 start_codon:yes stop_codon:yes gene_type:complete